MLITRITEGLRTTMAFMYTMAFSILEFQAPNSFYDLLRLSFGFPDILGKARCTCSMNQGTWFIPEYDLSIELGALRHMAPYDCCLC